MLTVETMVAFLKGKPDYDTLLGPFKDMLAKQDRSLPETTLEDKQLSRIRALSGHILNSSVMSSGAFNK